MVYTIEEEMNSKGRMKHVYVIIRLTHVIYHILYVYNTTNIYVQLRLPGRIVPSPIVHTS